MIRRHTEDPPLSTPGPRAGARAGFTIVEVIIAIMVLAIGVLGLAGTTAYSIRQITLADMLTKRSIALQSVVERVQSQPFASVGSGTDSLGVFRMSWSSTAESSTSKLVTVITTGPGLGRAAGNPYPFLRPNVVDTFRIRVISR